MVEGFPLARGSPGLLPPSQRFPWASELIIQIHEHSGCREHGQPLSPKSRLVGLGWAGSEGPSWELGQDPAWQGLCRGAGPTSGSLTGAYGWRPLEVGPPARREGLQVLGAACPRFASVLRGAQMCVYGGLVASRGAVTGVQCVLWLWVSLCFPFSGGGRWLDGSWSGCGPTMGWRC